MKGDLKSIRQFHPGDPDIDSMHEPPFTKEQFEAARPKLLDGKKLGIVIVYGTAGSIDKGKSFKDLWNDAH